MTARALLEQAPQREFDLLGELVQLADHPWAGTYRSAGSWPTTLRIAPRTGYTLYKDSKCGTCAGWLGLGRVHSPAGAPLELEVELGFEAPPVLSFSSINYSMEPTLHLVPWGPITFAIPPGSMELFCADFSGKQRFPRFPFRYTNGDSEFESPLRPQGFPQVPDEYKQLIVLEPKHCEAIELVEWSPWPAAQGHQAKLANATFRVTAGANEGLATGMRFFFDEGPFGRAAGRVEQVNPRSSRIVFTLRADQRKVAERMTRVGLSTLDPGADTSRVHEAPGSVRK